VTYPEDLVKIAFFEFRKEVKDNTNLKYWRDYFLGADMPEEAPSYIHKALDVLIYDNLDEEEKAVVDLQEKFDAIRDAEIYYSWDQGKAEGIIEGIIEGKAKGIIEGKAKGIIEGEAKGIIEGKVKGKIEVSVNMITELGITLSKAMSIMKLDEQFRDKVIEELRKQNIDFGE